MLRQSKRLGYMFATGEQASLCTSIELLIQDEVKSNPVLVPLRQALIACLCDKAARTQGQGEARKMKASLSQLPTGKMMCNKLVQTGFVPGGKAEVQKEIAKKEKQRKEKSKSTESMNHFLARGASRQSHHPCRTVRTSG